MCIKKKVFTTQFSFFDIAILWWQSTTAYLKIIYNITKGLLLNIYHLGNKYNVFAGYKQLEKIRIQWNVLVIIVFFTINSDAFCYVGISFETSISASDAWISWRCSIDIGDRHIVGIGSIRAGVSLIIFINVMGGRWLPTLPECCFLFGVRNWEEHQFVVGPNEFSLSNT